MKKYALLPILLMTFLPTLVIAQSDQTAFLQAVLSIFIGNPPNACFSDFASPLCVQCIGFLRLIPLAFFTVVFFFVFYIIMRNAGMVRVTKEGASGDVSATGSKIAALIAIILAIVFIHSGQVQAGLQTIMLFLSLAFVFLALFMIAYATRGMMAIVVIIVGIIIIVALWGYFWGSFSDIVKTWQSMCG
jgi:hypothetical protein